MTGFARNISLGTVAFAILINLSGCSEVIDRALPIPAKINKAFPPSPEVKVAEENFLLLLKDTKDEKSFKEQMASRLELRGLTCAQGVSIGRFTGLDDIRQAPISKDCLLEQDAKLQMFLGTQQIARRLAQDALRPAKPFGALSSFALPEGISQLVFLEVAAGANVGLVRAATGNDYASVELPSGRKIALLKSIEAGYKASVSPNGRITAIQGKTRKTVFADMESGEKLWETKDITEVLAWLPQAASALAIDSKGVLSIIDFQAGKIVAQSPSMVDPTWAVHLPGNDSNVIVGSSREFNIYRYVKTQDGVQTNLVKDLRSNHGISSGVPLLMRQGKSIVFLSGRELVAMDIESGAETTWQTGDYFANKYSKLSEVTLFVDTYLPHSPIGTEPWAFDIEQSTLAPLNTDQVKVGMLADFRGQRTGFLRRSNNILWIGDTVFSGAPVPIEEQLGKYRVEKQIAKLEAESSALAPKYSGTPAMAPTPTPPTAPFLVGGGSSVQPGISAQNARIEAIGIYESDSTRTSPVAVHVRRSATPIILVLNSYESVRWNLSLEAGAQLQAVLLSGYKQSTVSGAGQARIINIGQHNAYKQGGRDYIELNQAVIRMTGKGIGLFQGRYDGTSFSVGD